jgi:hypothetical protein
VRQADWVSRANHERSEINSDQAPNIVRHSKSVASGYRTGGKEAVLVEEHSTPNPRVVQVPQGDLSGHLTLGIWLDACSPDQPKLAIELSPIRLTCASSCYHR